MTWLTIGLVLLWGVVVAAIVVIYQLILQNGRILLRLEALEGPSRGGIPQSSSVPSRQSSLPIGSAAPDFELPDLSGRRRSLSEWRGERVLLIFFTPESEFCRRMLPALAALPSDPAAKHPTPIILSSGTVAENQRLIEEYGLSCPVLLRGDSDVAAAYFVSGTPMGYLVDESGRIASGISVGEQALLTLAGEPPAESSSSHDPSVATGAEVHPRHLESLPLTGSRLNRKGLSIGTQAPIFRLPRLDGGELSLLQYRGRRVLLVFSDPHCGPCNQLAPEMERLHRRSTDPQVLMISRGDPEANRKYAAKHGLAFPIALQRHWEVSRAYGMFATPIAYLIDEWGLIAAEVAVGKEAVLALADGPSAQAMGRAQAAGGAEGGGA